MKESQIYKFSWTHLIYIVLIGMIAYQLAFVWVPLWKTATHLQGTDLSAIQIEDENEQVIDLSSFKGKTLIINFWASWCLPCRLELPLLNGIYPRLLAQDKQLIGINQNESREKIKRFQEKTAILFPVYRDRGELAQKLNIQRIPAIAVIDENGKVESITYGFRPWIQAYLLWWI